MNLTIEKFAGIVKGGQVREYKKYPASLNLAASAAAHTAKKLNERVVVIEGNSYMNRVYHIAKDTDSVSKYTAMNYPVNVLIVEPNGECFYGVAE
jgi:predicted dinucleotide-utilizing enzyme